MSIEQQVQRILERAKARDLTIVTAESCTAGAVATALSKAPGAGDYFHGGFVTYTKEMKSAVLGRIDEATQTQRSGVRGGCGSDGDGRP
jgi:nicotinamide-nucleotide amidase